jgi:hypothetical protein
MTDLYKRNTLKEESVREPIEYFGVSIVKYSLPSCNRDDLYMKECWAMTADVYVKRALDDVERALADVGQYLRKRVSTPLQTSIYPKLDVSELLDDRQADYFPGVIGVLRWIVELGRADSATSGPTLKIPCLPEARAP